jgi:hypothetical protein
VVPPDAESPVDEPEQIVTAEAELIVGVELTDTVLVAVPLHPLVVPVIV